MNRGAEMTVTVSELLSQRTDQITFSTQFAYMSGCLFAASFEEFVNLYGELFTLQIINLRQQNCRDFFYKGTR